MSLQTWETVLTRPARPTPWYLYPLMAAAAIAGGYIVTSLKTAVLLFGALLIAIALKAVLTRPLNGFLIALCIFPEYTVFRGICELYEIPIPLSLIGMWPEVLLLIMFVSLLVSGTRLPGSGISPSLSVERPLHRLQLTWLDSPMVLIFFSGLYGLILSLLQQDTRAVLYGFHGSLTPFCFYFLARWLHHRPEDLSRVIRYWLIGFVVLAVFSIYDFIYRPDFFIKIAIQVREEFWGKFQPEIFFKWYPRMQSLLFAEQTWGTICGLVGMFCMARLGNPLPADTRKTRLWLWFVFALALFGLVFSMSRGAHACWIVACCVLFLFRGGHRKILITATILGVVALIVAFTFFGTEDRVSWLVMRTASLADPGNSVAYERVSQWERVLKIFPLFPAGRGLGKAAGYAMYHGTGDGFDFVPDGGYFKILAEQGIPGILLFLFGAFSLIGVLAKVARNSVGLDKALALAVLPIYCGMLVQNIGGTIFDLYFLPQLFWMLTGLVVGRYVAGVQDQRLRTASLPAEKTLTLAVKGG